MADYEISVGVNVDDSKINSLKETINSLKNETVTIKVDTKLANTKDLTKSLASQMKALVRESQKIATKNGSNNLADQLLNPEGLAKSFKEINKYAKTYGKNLDLGEVKLAINASTISDLDMLQGKLIKIKDLAHNMGSIKLSVGNNMEMVDGTLVVGPAKAKDSQKSNIKTWTNEMKQIAQAQGVLNKQLHFGQITKAEYDKQNLDLTLRNQTLLDNMKSTQNTAAQILANDAVAKIRTKAEKDLQSAINAADNYGKVYNSLQKDYSKYASLATVAGTDPSKQALKSELGKGYRERLSFLKDDLEAMEVLRSEMENQSGDALAQSQAKMQLYTAHAQKQSKQLKNIEQFYVKENTKYSKSEFIGTDLETTTDDMRLRMESISQSLANGKKYTNEYNAATGKMITTIDKGSGVIEQYQSLYKIGSGNIDTTLTKVSQQIKPFSSYISDLGGKFKQLSQYLISNFGFQALQKGVTSGITAVKDLDKAMTELKKTSSGTKQEYADFTKQANVDAKAIGSTTVQMTNSAADWSRLGFTLKDSSTMAKTTGILKNVSEFESIEDATGSMVGIMQAYGVKANESMDIVDKLNMIGNNYSISTSELAQGLQIAGSALQVGGNSMEQSMALITAMNSSVQDANQAARAARTVSMRMHGVDSETLQAEGEDIEGLVETVPKLESKIKSLTAVNGEMGISLTDATGKIRDDYSVLLEIAERWDKIGEADSREGTNRQSALLEALAGKNRANALASLLTNPEMLRNVYNDALNNSTGSAQNELNTYLDSIEAKTTKIQESWSQLWQSEGSTNAIKGILDFANGAINAVNFLGPGKVASSTISATLGQSLGWGRINYQLVL